MYLTQRKYFQDVVGKKATKTSRLQFFRTQYYSTPAVSYLGGVGASIVSQTSILKHEFSQKVQKESRGEDIRTLPKSFKTFPDLRALKDNFLLGDFQASQSERQVSTLLRIFYSHWIPL